MTVSPTIRSLAGAERSILSFFVVGREDGQVVLRVLGDDLGRDLGAVGQHDADLVAAGDDVAIGDDVAALVDDDAGADHFLAAPVAVASTLMVTMLLCVFSTASMMGVLREYWPWAFFSNPAPASTADERGQRRDQASSASLSSFRQPGDLALGREAHGFPPPPRDGFSIFGG